MIELILFALVGVLIGSLISFMPGLHVFNLAGFGVVLYLMFPAFPKIQLAMMMLGMLIAYAMVRHVSSTLLSSADDSIFFFILPGNKYARKGKGYEGALLLGIGGLGGLLYLMLMSPFLSTLVQPIRAITGPHLFWMIGLVLLYLLQSEWPRDFGTRAMSRLGRLWDGWSSLFAGIAVMALSGLVGIIILNRPPVPVSRSFQNIMPAFVGFFAIPWALQNIASKDEYPRQFVSKEFTSNKTQLTRGITSGSLGGSLAAFTPLVTAGIGGLFAGHATNTRDNVSFSVSYGASSFVYYVGAYMLLWIPLVHMTRGGMGWITSVVFTPEARWEFWIFVAALAIAGIAAFAMLMALTRFAMKVDNNWGYRKVSYAVLPLLFVIVWGLTGFAGLALMVICSGIGLMPVLLRTRRLNCMGVLIVPIFLSMAGIAPRIVEWLGLIG